jgi:Transposase IS116/IS110/IS902 family
VRFYSRAAIVPENFLRCVLKRVKIVASFTEASVLKHAHLLQVRARRSGSCDTRTMRASGLIGVGIDTPRFYINLRSGLATSRLPTSIAVVPPGLAQALEQIAEMSLKIKQYARQILELAQSEYPRDACPAKGSRPPHHSTDLCPDPWEQGTLQAKSGVGCYLGLRPRRNQSGERDPQLGITKAGNSYLRSLA